MAGLRLHLLVPGLFGPLPRQASEPGFDWPAAPALERLLARSDADPDNDSHGARLFRLFGLTLPPGGELPSAALCRLGEGLPADAGCWMHADPVHLQTDRDRVLLFDARHLDLNMEQARRLADEVEAYYADDAWRLELVHPERWYLRLPEPPALRSHSLEAVVGRHIEPYLPEGGAAADWRFRLNETQMLLHAAAVNEERVSMGLRPVNGLWYWGAGELPPVPPETPFNQVWADDPLTRGLARRAGLEPSPQPRDLAQLLAAVPGGDLLVLLDRLQGPLLDGDLDSWVDGIQVLEIAWFRPLREALARRRIERLNLYPLARRQYRCTPGALRRFWRRGRPLRALVAEATES
jgi:hypothetical protein